MVRVGRIVLQQLCQRGSPGQQQGRSQTHLDSFQIELALLVSLVNHRPQEAFYFAREFLMDRLRRFFSWTVCTGCSTGRKRQIFRFTSTNSPVRVWNFRNPAISLSALRTAA